MRKLMIILLMGIALSVAWLIPALAQVPQHINHQGVLTDSSGVLVADQLDPYVIDFDIYDSPDPAGGTLLFHQQLAVTVEGGLYNVLLSDNAGSPKSLAETFLKEHTYLQLTIVSGGIYSNEVLLPRQQLASVPYAFSAGNYTREFTTGDVKLTFKTVPETGWILVDDDDGSIGNALSGATTYAADDAHDLFVLLWANIPEAWVPVENSGGTGVSRGADAESDWTANRRLLLPKMLGRALAVAGSGAGLTSRALGENLGAETHQLTEAEMPSHTHDMIGKITGGNSTMPHNGGTGTDRTLATESAGSDTAHNNMQPTAFLNVMIKL